MQRPKLQETPKLITNYTCVVGTLTTKGRLIEQEEKNYIKFMICENIFCLALGKYATMINVIELGSMLLIEGVLKRVGNQMLLVVANVEIYTVQPKIDKELIKQEIKLEKTKF